ncbi:MAG: hypothetical protein RIR26_2027 [Pseudomonadota bacterium]
MKSVFFVFSGVVLLSVVSFLTGPATPWSDWIAGGFSPSSVAQFFQGNPALFGLRLSHVVLAFSVGAALSAAGRTMQMYLQNPLADPHVVGLSAGSTSAILLGLLFLPDVSGRLFFGVVPAVWIFSACGAIVSLIFAYFLFFGVLRHRGAASFALVGLLLNAGFSALLMLVYARLSPSALSQVQTWTLGTIQPHSPAALSFLTFVLLLSSWLLIRLDAALTVMSFGSEFAIAQGVNVVRLRNRLLICLAVVSAASVAAAGAIGFVGLLVPHMTRRLFGAVSFAGERPYLNALLGAALLVLADLASRSLTAPLELPVGVFTALFSTPFLLVLLLRQKAHT